MNTGTFAPNRLQLLALCLWAVANAAGQLAIGALLTQRVLAAAGTAVGNGLWLGWLALLAAAWALALTALVWTARGLPRLAMALGASLQAFALLALTVDLLLYEAQSVHLDDPAVAQAWHGGMFLRDTHLGFATVASIFTAFACACAVQWPLMRLAHWLAQPPRRNFAWAAIAACMVGVGVLWQSVVPAARAAIASRTPLVDALPLQGRLLDPPGSAGLLAVEHPGRNLAQGHQIVARKGIVLLFVESLRADALTAEWMPRTVALHAGLPCLRSVRHYSASHATTWAVFSALSGLDAWLYVPASRQRVPSTPLALLHASGYRLEGVSASQLRGWEHGDALVAPFDRWQEPQAAEPWQRDLLVTAEVKRLIHAHGPASPLFLFAFLYAPHHNYHFPPEYLRHMPVLPENYNHFAPDSELAKQKEGLLNRYHNAVGFADAQVAEILEALRPGIVRGDWLVVVAGDHGEEFWDHGAVGHGAARFWNARTQVPLLFCGAGLQEVAVGQSSHTDLLPTVLDFLGVAPPLPIWQWSTGQSLLHPDPDHRVAVTGVGFPETGRGVALVGPRHKAWLQRRGAADDFAIDKLTDLADLPLPVTQVEQATAETRADLKGLSRRIWRFLRRQAAVHATPPAGDQPIDARLGGALQLVGVDRPAGPLQPGADVRVRMTYRVQAAVPPGYALFAHLKSADGRVFVNIDRQPGAGAQSVQEWPVGAFVVDELWFKVPNALPTGATLALWVGLWHAQLGRLPVTSAEVVVDGAILLAKWPTR